MQTFAKIIFTLSQPRRPFVPFISLKGIIDREKYSLVEYYLERMPKKSKMLAIVINSSQGQFSQAFLIASLLRRKAKQYGIQLVTFGQEYALNSGFLLLMCGDRVFIDKNTLIGGLQNSQSKYITSMLQNITYTNAPSYEAILKNHQPYDPHKSQELRKIFEQFSDEARQKILSFRGDKLVKETNLLNFYDGKQALEAGLVDGLGRLHKTIPELIENPNIEMLKLSKLDKYNRYYSKLNIDW